MGQTGIATRANCEQEDGSKSSPYLRVEAGCIACGWCKLNCPIEDCITFEAAIATIRHDLCTECSRCVHVCPVNAITPLRKAPPRKRGIRHRHPESFGVVVIGAGLGGMLAACQLAQAGRKVLLAENLSFLGGRFSGFHVKGSEIPSGALHAVPHGDRGPLAQALRRSGVNIGISRAKVFASFHVSGEHIVARRPIDALRICSSLSEKVLVLQGLLRTWWRKRYEGSFGDWLLEIGVPDLVRTTIDRFCQFSLSTTVDDVPYAEGRRVIEMIFRYGLPGVPKGGAREVARRLGLAAAGAGVVIRKSTRAQGLVLDDHRVRGVTLLDRRRGDTYEVQAPLVISNIGPINTLRMCQESGLPGDNGRSLPLPPPPVTGLSLHVLSPKSLIHHDAIMFCLDTQRVTGIVQVSNLDHSLAPPGKHLLISHQPVPQGADWLEERRLALQDWEYLFGNDFGNCEVLGSSHFPAQFPVNWAAQGYDWREQPLAERGLWMVGDGMKPEGLMMVEGVAASAESVVRQILGVQSTSPWEASPIEVWLRRIGSWVAELTTRE